jgi:hypothetical protein
MAETLKERKKAETEKERKKAETEKERERKKKARDRDKELDTCKAWVAQLVFYIYQNALSDK